MIKKWSVLECTGITVVYEGERWPYAGCAGDEPEVRAVWHGDKKVSFKRGVYWEMKPADVAAAHALADSHNSMIGMPIKPV